MHCTFGTAFRDLRTLGKLTSGERVLITGANGGVGSAAVQIAKRLDAHVTAVVRDNSHVEYLRGLGADQVVVDSGRGFHKNGGIGKVDLALEAVGQPTFNSALRCLRVGGRIVVVGNVVAEKVSVNLGYLITMGLSIIGGSGANRMDMAAVLAMHQEKPFEVPIHCELTLDDAEQAQQLVHAGGLRGRVVLVNVRSA